MSRSSVRFACTEASSHGKNCKQFVHPRRYSHENSLDTRGALRAPPCIEGVFMGIVARVHEFLPILAMRRRLSTRKSHGTPGQGYSKISKYNAHLEVYRAFQRTWSSIPPRRARGPPGVKKHTKIHSEGPQKNPCIIIFKKIWPPIHVF